jgi:hypothetical protein
VSPPRQHIALRRLTLPGQFERWGQWATRLINAAVYQVPAVLLLDASHPAPGAAWRRMGRVMTVIRCRMPIGAARPW